MGHRLTSRNILVTHRDELMGLPLLATSMTIAATKTQQIDQIPIAKSTRSELSLIRPIRTSQSSFLTGMTMQCLTLISALHRHYLPALSNSINRHRLIVNLVALPSRPGTILTQKGKHRTSYCSSFLYHHCKYLLALGLLSLQFPEQQKRSSPSYGPYAL